MAKTDDVQLTDEELKTVNETILAIQSDLKKAIEEFNNNNFDKAIEYINSGMSRTKCPLCQKKMTLLKADVVHTKTICPVDADLCIAEKEAVNDTATEIKDEFVPMANTKKAIKEKKTSLRLNEATQNSQVLFPLPHEILLKLFSRRV